MTVGSSRADVAAATVATGLLINHLLFTVW